MLKGEDDTSNSKNTTTKKSGRGQMLLYPLLRRVNTYMNKKTINTVSTITSMVILAIVSVGTYLYGVPFLITNLLQVWGITIPFSTMQLTCSSLYGLYFAFAPFRYKPANRQ